MPRVATCFLVACCSHLAGAEEPTVGSPHGGWTETFSGPGVAALLPEGARDVLVVPAGALKDEARPAAEVLAAALAGLRPELPRFAAVLPLGPADAGDDALVAAAAREAGADPAHTGHLVVVVRVYPPSDGAAPTALLALFDRRGARLQTIVGVKGKPLTPPATPAVAQAAIERDRAALADQLAAVRAYGNRYIGLRNPRADNLEDAEPFQGLAHQPLEGQDLYRALGREDLARHYRNRQIARYAVIFGGGAASLAAGIGLLVGGINQKSTYGCVQQQANGLCALYGVERPNYVAWYATSALFFALVPGSIIAGAAADADPISVRQGRKLIDEHNTGLRIRYRVPDSQPDPEPRGDGGSTSLFITPMAGPQGGGLAISGVFP